MNQNELLIAIFGGVVGVVLIVGLICLMWRLIKRCKRNDEFGYLLSSDRFSETPTLESNLQHQYTRV